MVDKTIVTPRELFKSFHPGMDFDKLLEGTSAWADFDAYLQHMFGIGLDTELVAKESNG